MPTEAVGYRVIAKSKNGEIKYQKDFLCKDYPEGNAVFKARSHVAEVFSSYSDCSVSSNAINEKDLEPCH